MVLAIGTFAVSCGGSSSDANGDSSTMSSGSDTGTMVAPSTMDTSSSMMGSGSDTSKMMGSDTSKMMDTTNRK